MAELVLSKNALAQPDRVIRKVLIDGFAFYAQDAYIEEIDAMFQGQTQDEIDAVKDFVQTWKTKRRIVAGYPSGNVELPKIAVVLRGENDSMAFLNNLILVEDSPNTGAYGVRQRGTYGIGIYTENASLTTNLYTLVKHILLAKFLYLEKYNVTNIVLSGGDLEPNPEYLPAYVYLRFLNVEAEYLHAVRIPISQVGGRVAGYNNSMLNDDGFGNVSASEDTHADISLAEFTIEMIDQNADGAEDYYDD